MGLTQLPVIDVPLNPNSKCYDISNTLALYVFYFNELLKNVAYFKINAIILDLLIGRMTIKKFDLFNQVPSQLKDFDEKPITAVLKLLESVKISRVWDTVGLFTWDKCRNPFVML